MARTCTMQRAHRSGYVSHLAGQHVQGGVDPAAPGTVQRRCTWWLAEPGAGLVALQPPEQVTSVPHPASGPLSCKRYVTLGLCISVMENGRRLLTGLLFFIGSACNLGKHVH